MFGVSSSGLRLVVGFSAALLPALTTFATVIPLQNPGFEDGQLYPWVATITHDTKGQGNPTYISGVTKTMLYDGTYGFAAEASIAAKAPPTGNCIENYAKVTAEVHQSVMLSSPQTGRFTFSAWAYGSVYTSGGAYGMRVGIDTTGGTDASAPTVVWGAYGPASFSWQRLQVTAPQSTTNMLTVFLQGFATDDLISCGIGTPATMGASVAFDDAYLTDEPNSPPSADVISPTPGQPLLNPVTFEVRVSDPDDTIELIEVYVDGKPITGEYGPPGDYTFEPEYVPIGVHSVVSKVTDAWGNVTNTNPIAFEVMPDHWMAIAPTGGHAFAVGLDPDGNVYVTGSQALNGSTGVTTVKYDNHLRQVWLRNYPDATVEAGDRILLAVTQHAVLVAAPQRADSGKAVAVIRYGFDGSVNWVRLCTAGTGRDAAPRAMVADAYDDAFLTCASTNSATHLNGGTLLVELSPDGLPLWGTEYFSPTGLANRPNAMTLVGASSVCVTGAEGTYSRVGELLGKTYLTAMFSGNDGSLAWARTHPGVYDASFPQPVAIAADPSGNVYIAGAVAGANEDFLTIKYDQSGTEVWVRQLNGPGDANDVPAGIAVGPTGGVFVAGMVAADMGFGVVKYDSDGNLLWFSHHSADGGTNVPIAMWLDAVENVYVTGLEISGQGLTVAWDNQGDELWTDIELGQTGVGAGPLLAISGDNAGSVYMAGAAQVRNVDQGLLTIKHPLQSAEVIGNVTLGNFVGNPAGIPFELSLKDGDAVVDTMDATLSSLGNYFAFTDAAGTHDVLAKLSHWLTTKQTGLALSGLVRVDWNVPFNGDAVQDDAVNLGDLSFVLAKFGSQNAQADVDGSGAVGLGDLSIVLRNFGKHGDP